MNSTEWRDRCVAVFRAEWLVGTLCVDSTDPFSMNSLVNFRADFHARSEIQSQSSRRFHG